MDLRCESGILHGVDNENGTIEFRCRSNRCGHRAGVVVLHTFDLRTGEYTTAMYAELEMKERKVNINGSHNAVRAS